MLILTCTCNFTNEELHFTNCKQHKTTSEFIYQHFSCVEVDIDADILVTCWLSTWWDCSNIYMWGACRWCIPAVKVIWYSIESQFGKASVTVTVVVQCDGSQRDSCGEYEQQLPITPSSPFIIFTTAVLFLSKVRVYQFKLGTITVDIVSYNGIVWMISWIVPTVSTGTLSSVDRVVPIGIL